MATPGNQTPGEQALAEAARIEAARVYGSTSREHSQTQPAPATASGVFRRPVDTYYGAAPSTAVADLLDAIVPRGVVSKPRVQVQQAIARGLGDDQISYLLDVDTSYAAEVRAEMDRASA